MNIVVLDGYTLNPGDNPWTPLEAFGKLTPAQQRKALAVLVA
jgi:glycerate dehydrogenase